MADTNFAKLHCIIKIKLLIQEIYSMDSAGGGLHIVLDDLNVDSESIEWCLENSIPKEENAWMRRCCKECASLLLDLNEMERASVINEAYKEIQEC